MPTRTPTALHAKILTCVLFVALASDSGAAHGWRRGRHDHPPKAFAGFVPNNQRSRSANGPRSPERSTDPCRYSPQCIPNGIRISGSLNDDDDPTDATNNNEITDEMETTPFDDDPDGIPLFDTNERATLFGLEPNADLDGSLDNGLVFTGPIILFFSVYLTLSVFFGDDIPPLDLTM